jgi:hypothetical protein
MKTALWNLANRLPFLAVLVFLSVAQFCANAGDLPAGTAKGTLTPEDKPTVTLAYAAAFVDQKEDDKPVLLILSDKKLPVEKWTSEMDMMMAQVEFTGAVFFFDKEGTVFRIDVHSGGRQESVSGYFKLKLDGPMGKDLKGEVKPIETTTPGPKLDAVFHATLK